MSKGRTLVIGDLQGCYDAFCRLLECFRFEEGKDRLWLAGDLVNRGPDSLKTLRLCHQLREGLICVLGNHDLHLLAMYLGGKPAKKKDTLEEILFAEDCGELLSWLRHQPLLHYDSHRDALLVHAGILPQWSVEDALGYAREVEQAIRAENASDFFREMYGNEPSSWSSELQGMDRLRIITNVLTRMRVLNAEGALDLKFKGPKQDAPPGLKPWFDFPRKDATRIYFGHWAALEGRSQKKGFYAMDTACVWGGKLRARDLDDGTEYEVPAEL